MKICSACQQERSWEQYYESNPWTCRACVRARAAARYINKREECLASMKKWAENNKQRSREIKQAYRARNRETERQYHAFRRLEQPEKVAAINKRYREEHPEVYTEARAARRAAELQATPRWVNRLAIQAMYAKAVFMSRQQGVPFEVDHIIPLQGEQVCGLHVACNLQILSRHENRSKSNRMLEAI